MNHTGGPTVAPVYVGLGRNAALRTEAQRLRSDAQRFRETAAELRQHAAQVDKMAGEMLAQAVRVETEGRNG